MKKKKKKKKQKMKTEVDHASALNLTRIFA
jgi:hypothetical protein